ncbi:hypothetical protein BKA70DRAFT_1031576, partial [Coprinopsis sp. MPI-PUGE-AT-0042]
MAQAARNYHDGLQREGKCLDVEVDLREQRIKETLDALKTQVTDTEYNTLEEMLERSEVEEALRLAPAGKAAGLDGIPAELYKALKELFASGNKDEEQSPWVDIIKFLHVVFNDIENFGVDPSSDFAE